MPRIQGTVHVDAPIERVFDVALDLMLLSRYMPSVKEVSRPSGPADAAGTTYAFRSVTFGRSFRGTIEVLQARRPAFLQTLTRYDNGIRVTWSQALTPAASGTDETDEIDVEIPGGIVGRLLAPLVIWQMRREISASLAPYAKTIMSE